MLKRILTAAIVAATSFIGAFGAVNPAASKAYVDKQISDLRTEIRENGVFTNTLQEIVNIYTNTYTDVTFKTNVTVKVENVTTNTYQYNYTVNNETNFHYAVYDITTNYIFNTYSTNWNFYVTSKTNITVELTEVTNIYTEVHTTTNMDVYVTNVVNIVTNDIVFTDTISYTNIPFGISGYTGLVIRASGYEIDSDIPTGYTTNAIVFAPRADMENTYTNADYTLTLMKDVSPFGDAPSDWYYVFTNGVAQYMGAIQLSSAEYEDPSLDLNLTTGYTGDSWATASKMTLLYCVSMSATDLVFILFRVDVAEEERNTRVVKYNPTMAAGFSDEARRLTSDGGLQWIDPTGTWWEVSSAYPVRAYEIFERTLLEEPPNTEDDPNEDARFVGSNCTLTHGLRYQSETEVYSVWKVRTDFSPYYMESETLMSVDDYHGLEPLVYFYSEQTEMQYDGFACTAYTNGVVHTNAVRRVLFDDSIAAGHVASLYDGKSITTNRNGALQVSGFWDAGTRTVPFYDGVYGGGEHLTWITMPRLQSYLQDAVNANSAWRFDGTYLQSCYVQIGRGVYAAGQGGIPWISMSGKAVGDYCVGISYVGGSGTGYSIAFGLKSQIDSGGYETVLFVGTYSQDSTTHEYVWSGVSSIPVVLVFE